MHTDAAISYVNNCKNPFGNDDDEDEEEAGNNDVKSFLQLHWHELIDKFLDDKEA